MDVGSYVSGCWWAVSGGVARESVEGLMAETLVVGTLMKGFSMRAAIVGKSVRL